MAAALPTKRISIEDFRDAPKEIRPTLEKLIFILNGFLTATYNALSGNLTIPENVSGMYKDFEITAGPNADDNVFDFTHTLKTKPRGCSVVHCEEISGATVAITNPVWVSWHLGAAQKQIQIDAITGLTDTKKYRVTVKVE